MNAISKPLNKVPYWLQISFGTSTNSKLTHLFVDRLSLGEWWWLQQYIIFHGGLARTLLYFGMHFHVSGLVMLPKKNLFYFLRHCYKFHTFCSCRLVKCSSFFADVDIRHIITLSAHTAMSFSQWKIFQNFSAFKFYVLCVTKNESATSKHFRLFLSVIDWVISHIKNKFWRIWNLWLYKYHD